MKKIFAKSQNNSQTSKPINSKFIAYNTLKSSKNKEPCIIFSHGLMSDRHSSKALAIESYCADHDFNYIRYDNFGSGDSSGDFQQENISSWLEGLMMVIDQLTSGSVILVGSSKGSWLTLLAAQNYPNRIEGIVNIATATDFTEEIIWNNLSLEQQQEMQDTGGAEITGRGSGCNYIYPISFQLIEDGRQHLMLNKKQIAIDCPVHLIHGMLDIDVPYSYSIRTAEKIRGNKVITKLIKDGDHKLSRPEDIKVITNSIREIMNKE